MGIELFITDCVNIIGRGLVDKVVQPVGKKQICARPPGNLRFGGVVIVREVVYGNFDGFSSGFIPHLFEVQSSRIVFGVPRDEDLSAAVGRHSIDTCLIRRGKNFKPVYRFDVLTQNGGVA